MNIINTDDLKIWAARIDAFHELPELVCRLIRCTTIHLQDVAIPLGKNIWRGGWDGAVEAGNESEFVPAGISLWEFGTTDKVEQKANEEYVKRTGSPGDYEISKACFIFVTPRVWPEKQNWIKEKKNELKWGDIRVYDGEKMEQWLMQSPVQSMWVAKQIRNTPYGAFTLLNDFWGNWSAGPGYDLPLEIITTGREKIRDNVAALLNTEPSVIPLQAPSKDEALAFFVSTILQLEISVKEDVLSRACIVESIDAFKVLTANRDSLVLLINFDAGYLLNAAVKKGHYILLPLGADDDIDGKQSMPDLDRDGFIAELRKTGITEERARMLSRECARSISVFRRHEKFEYIKPAWSGGANIPALLPALLAGKWDNSIEGDRNIIEQISGKSYSTVEAVLRAFVNIPDAPVKQIGSQWRLTSPADAWRHLSKFAAADDFEKLKQAFLEAVSEDDPALDLPLDIRHIAALYGKQTKYSEALKEGLTESLILLAIYGDQYKVSLSHPVQTWVDAAVNELFQRSNAKFWRSVKGRIPLVAEASPVAFLNSMENALTSKCEDIQWIYEESDEPLAERGYHTGYLWALEGLAWMPSQLSRASLVLAKLDEIDTGSRLSNRPGNSLHNIFFPFLPQTLATSDERLIVLELLAKRTPEQAWELCLSLIPDRAAIAFPTFRLRWRLSVEGLESAPGNVENKHWAAIIQILLQLAKMDAEKLSQLANKLNRKVPYLIRQQIIQYITVHQDKIMDAQHVLWNSLRKLLYHHRSIPHAVWAVPANELVPVEALFHHFTPASVVDARIWAFEEHWPQDADGYNGGKPSDPDIQCEVIKRRQKYTEEIYNDIGAQGLIDIMPRIRAQNEYGQSVAAVIHKESEINLFLSQLASEEHTVTFIVRAFIFHKFLSLGYDWINGQVKRLLQENQPEDVIAKMLVALPQGTKSWDFVGTISKGVETTYWSIVPWLQNLEPAERIYAVQKLVSVKRYSAALTEAPKVAKDLSTDYLAGIVYQAKLEQLRTNMHLDNEAATKLLLELDLRNDCNKETLLQLEYLYVPMLLSDGNERGLLATHAELTSNASFFMEAATMVYPPDEGVNEVQSKADNEPAEFQFDKYNYCEILRSWDRVPGVQQDGELDETLLKAWITEAKELAKQANRIAITDAFIGKIMAQIPLKEDYCPSETVCGIIETIHTDEIQRNYSAFLMNHNSFTSRGVFEGGGIERVHSSVIRQAAAKMAFQWPVMAALYEKMAVRYDEMAAAQDNRAAVMNHDY